MKFLHRISPIVLALCSLSFIAFTTPALANYTARDMDHAYDDGYDDGYDDAMDDCPCPPKSFFGWYLGLGGGYEGYQTVQQPFVLDDPIGRLNTHANGWNGRLYGGYGFNYNRYYLGVEGLIGTSNASGSNTINTRSTQYMGTFSAGTSYGASLLPGIRVSDNGPLIYGRLGALRTDFTVKDWSGTLGSSNDYWKTGMNYGVGAEFPVYKNITTRFEYDYINYSNFNHTGNISSKNSPADNRGTIDFTYHFNR